VLFHVYWDTNKVKISSYEIPIKNLPPVLEKLNIVLTADIQVDRYTSEAKLKSLQTHLQELSPDIIFFAGDLVTNGNYYIDQGIDILCQAEANTARIACVGDHDYWANPGRIADGLKNCGWEFLDDRHHIINYQGTKILVTGISYIYSKRISPARLKQLLETAPEADVKILLVHQPKEYVMKNAADYGYDLFLAGHTHGGQILFKPFGVTLTTAQLENDIFSGVSLHDKMNVIISKGIGMSLVPVRYRAQAEIVQFRLKRSD
jgi:predicted MPP superfamily phosphohydrolase